MRIRICLALCFLTSFLAAEPSWWMNLEQGKRYFRQGDYGQAMLSFEDANRARSRFFEERYDVLVSRFSTRAVRAIGDDLKSIERYLFESRLSDSGRDWGQIAAAAPKGKLRDSSRILLSDIRNIKAKTPEERNAIIKSVLKTLSDGEIAALCAGLDSLGPEKAAPRLDALAVIAELRTEVPAEKLGNSAKNAVQILDSLKLYPEADFWIGEVYKAEGELDVAMKQYMKAYNGREWLGKPSDARDILYRMADINGQKALYNDMEAELKTILAEDILYTDFEKQDSSLAKAITTTFKQGGSDRNGIDRFLTLYRQSTPQFYRAHQQLGLYYTSCGLEDNARRHLIFAFLIEATSLIDELGRIDPDWRFTSFRQVLDMAEKDDRLSSSIASTDFYKTMYYLAHALYFSSDPVRSSANDLWRLLSRQGHAGEWRGRSLSQLKSPAQELQLVKDGKSVLLKF